MNPQETCNGKLSRPLSHRMKVAIQNYMQRVSLIPVVSHLHPQLQLFSLLVGHVIKKTLKTCFLLSKRAPVNPSKKKRLSSNQTELPSAPCLSFYSNAVRLTARWRPGSSPAGTEGLRRLNWCSAWREPAGGGGGQLMWLHQENILSYSEVINPRLSFDIPFQDRQWRACAATGPAGSSDSPQLLRWGRALSFQQRQAVRTPSDNRACLRCR